MAAVKVGGILTDLLDVDVDVSKCDQDDCCEQNPEPEDAEEQNMEKNRLENCQEDELNKDAGTGTECEEFNQRNELEVPVEVILTEKKNAATKSRKPRKKPGTDTGNKSRKLRRLESSSNKPATFTQTNLINVMVPQVVQPVVPQVFVNLPVGYIIMKPQQQTSCSNLEAVMLEPRVGDIRQICKWIDAGVSKPCDKLITGHQDLVTHIWDHINLSKCAKGVCLWENCERRKRPFKSRSNLIQHMCVHTGYKPMCCPHPGCGKTFDSPSALHTHQRVHNEYTFPCTHAGCSEVFFSITTRNNHYKIQHLGDDRHKCAVQSCGKVFPTNVLLQRHVRTHK